MLINAFPFTDSRIGDDIITINIHCGGEYLQSDELKYCETCVGVGYCLTTMYIYLLVMFYP
jgi:hypothetical protein